ncbi:MAG: sodium:calcium antiporter [Gammaproteobacteria bacterium]|jgi:cation:H+ antiporter
MHQIPDLTLSGSVVLFAVAAVLIVIFGTKTTHVAATLAQKTRLGEALMGVLFVGAFTSLAEIATTITAATNNYPQLAVSNAIGSIAGQTAFLAVVDFTYRKANLEHAAASAENLTISAFLMTLLALPLLALAYPEVELFGIHPMTPVIVLVYIFGLKLISRSADRPMWHPQMTRETRTSQDIKTDKRYANSKQSLLWLWFFLFAVVMAASGWALAVSAIAISHHTHMSETLAGVLLTGLVSSLPELITAYAAVRIGALTLAVGNILGGNAFDTLLVALADVTYAPGSIYAALQPQQHFLLALTLVMTGTILLGMLQRQKHGFANIGLESSIVLMLYGGGVAWLAWAPV